MLFRRKRKLGEKGQSTVEFALTLMLMMGFILFFTQISFLFAYGNLVHYATFMAARAYLSASDTLEDQQDRAKYVIVQLLKKSQGQQAADKYPFIAHGDGGTNEIPGLMLGPSGQFDPQDKTKSWMQGVRYRFTGKLTSVPFGGNKGAVNQLTLTSESWLGRERSAAECLQYFTGGKVLDNGC